MSARRVACPCLLSFRKTESAVSQMDGRNGRTMMGRGEKKNTQKTKQTCRCAGKENRDTKNQREKEKRIQNALWKGHTYFACK